MISRQHSDAPLEGEAHLEDRSAAWKGIGAEGAVLLAAKQAAAENLIEAELF